MARCEVPPWIYFGSVVAGAAVLAVTVRDPRHLWYESVLASSLVLVALSAAACAGGISKMGLAQCAQWDAGLLVNWLLLVATALQSPLRSRRYHTLSATLLINGTAGFVLVAGVLQTGTPPLGLSAAYALGTLGVQAGVMGGPYWRAAIAALILAASAVGWWWVGCAPGSGPALWATLSAGGLAAIAIERLHLAYTSKANYGVEGWVAPVAVDK